MGAPSRCTFLQSAQDESCATLYHDREARDRQFPASNLPPDRELLLRSLRSSNLLILFQQTDAVADLIQDLF